jgi:glycosyltransferase involved in cell wall biosynthesis
LSRIREGRMSEGARVSVIILTYNEERHIERAIASVAPFAQEVFVVDSGSTDRTVELARVSGAAVLSHPFVNQARQFQWALDHAPITGSWVMRLDADEFVEPELAAEITTVLPTLGDEVAGVNLRRKHIFLGRWIRHGGRYPLILLRIWRRGQGRVEDRWMDEHIAVSGGRTVTLRHDFADCNLNDLAYFTDKHNKYATREAIEVLNQRRQFIAKGERLTPETSSRQAAFKRFIKEAVYNRVPFQLGALAYFLFRYVVQLGFLDGREGLIYHFLQGYWYRFLVGARVLELERAVAHLNAKPAVRAELARVTGLKIE